MKTPPILAAALVSLLLAAPAALAVKETWDGGGANDNVSTGANWADNTAPVSDIANTNLVFSGTVRPTPIVNVSLSVASIVFDNTATAFTISSSGATGQLRIGTGGIANNDTELQTFTNSVVFFDVATSVIDAAAGPLHFINGISLPLSTLTVMGNFDTEFGGVGGLGAVLKQGTGTMSWMASGTLECEVTVSAGTWRLAPPTGLSMAFTPNGSLAIEGTSVLDIDGDLTLDGAPLTRSSGGDINLATGKTLTVQNNADVTITGSFSNTTASSIVVTDPGSTLRTTGGGFVFGGGSTVDIDAGGAVTAGTTLNIGTSGNGTVTVDGNGSSLGAGSTLSVGLNGATGHLTFSSLSTGSFNTMNVDASVVTGTSGTVEILSSATVTGTGLSISPNANANTGLVRVSGSGSLLALTGAAVATIGAASTSSGTLDIQSGGTFQSGTGTTTVNATGTISIAGTYQSRGNLTLNGGSLTRSVAGVLTLDPATTLRVQSGSDATITGAFTNASASTIEVSNDSTLSTTSGLTFGGGTTAAIDAGADVTAGTTLTLGTTGGGATVTVDGTGSSLGASSTLNVGLNGATAGLTFSNASTGSFATINVDASTFAGTDGTLEILSGARVTGTGLAIALNTAANTGDLRIDGAGSKLTVNGASTVTFGAASASTATVNVQSSGELWIYNPLTSLRATGTVAIAGGKYYCNGDLTVDGGLLTRDATGTFALADGKTLTVQGGGDALFTGSWSTVSSTIAVSGAGSTLSTDAFAFYGTTVSVSASGSLSTDFILVAAFPGSSNSAVTIDGAGTNLNAAGVNGGVLVGRSGGTSTLTFANSSTGVCSRIDVAYTDATSVPGTVGNLNIGSGASVSGSLLTVGFDAANDNIAQTGTVVISGSGSKLTVTGSTTLGAASATTGTVTVQSGSTFTTGTVVTVNATGSLNVQAGGILTGAADYAGTGPITLAGFFLPGTASGANRTTSVSFAQNIAFQSTSALVMELGGTTAGTAHDQLVFNGPGATQVTWNGTLSVVTINGFVPQAGHYFNLFDFVAGRGAGAFTSINLPALGPGLFWRTEDLYSQGVIYVATAPATYAEWQATYGTGAWNADDDGDGVRNGIEFLLATNPKAPFAAGATPIKELPAVGNKVRVTFDVPETPANDAHYIVQSSPDLTTWTDIASQLGGSGWTANAGIDITADPAAAGYLNIIVSETVPIPTTRRFHRLIGTSP